MHMNCVHMDSTLHVVTSHWSEDIRWLQASWPSHTVCDKTDNPNFLATGACHTVNHGREASAYLKFIVLHYDSLPATHLAFIHGHNTALHQWPYYMSMHQRLQIVERVLQRRNVQFMGLNNIMRPRSCLQFEDWSSDTFAAFWKACMQDVFGKPPNVLKYDYCAQFVVSAQRICNLPKHFYARLLDFVLDNRYDSWVVGYCLETTWHIIFGNNHYPVITDPAFNVLAWSEAGVFIPSFIQTVLVVVGATGVALAAWAARSRASLALVPKTRHGLVPWMTCVALVSTAVMIYIYRHIPELLRLKVRCTGDVAAAAAAGTLLVCNHPHFAIDGYMVARAVKQAVGETPLCIITTLPQLLVSLLNVAYCDRGVTVQRTSRGHTCTLAAERLRRGDSVMLLLDPDHIAQCRTGAARIARDAGCVVAAVRIEGPLTPYADRHGQKGHAFVSLGSLYEAALMYGETFHLHFNLLPSPMANQSDANYMKDVLHPVLLGTFRGAGDRAPDTLTC